ncbi:uncharacterized protein Tco025E_05426 [Trypanosoma conorhini]|uniref:Flagellar attachment zone protein 1 conserved domain-containing protein n=1 Tax=Trypanosoma conorhini TaxID=83891 RepID=A0A3R7L3V8_9TRYP|nr:uncharacterized protein Tco025E_05426 [Trypanosoma conorhini]RNF15768.1 hypothetical protein Tco025E_05426 [Trypanosoma conorhini]
MCKAAGRSLFLPWLGAKDCCVRPQSLRWTRHVYNLGKGWVPLVSQYRQLVGDVLLLEVSRATCLPSDCVRRVEFAPGGLVAEFEVLKTKEFIDVDGCLRRHSFGTMSALMELSRSGVRQMSFASVSEVDGVSEVPTHVYVGAQLLSPKAPMWPESSKAGVTMRELELFRCRRALASRMRRMEETLQPSSGFSSGLDAAAPVDPYELQREPVYCVTLEEYRAVLQRCVDARDQGTDDEDGDDSTRLWNEHVVARAEEERRFTQQLGLSGPCYAQLGRGSSNTPHRRGNGT